VQRGSSLFGEIDSQRPRERPCDLQRVRQFGEGVV
jgi:hypothetical protein